MMSNESNSFQPLFMLNPDDPDSNCALSLYFEQSDLTRLLALVQEFGSLRIFKEGQNFILDFGTHRFSARNHLNEASLTLRDPKKFTHLEAKKLLLLANFLFFERKAMFMLTATDLNDELLVWTLARELDLGLEASNPEQAERFQSLAFEEEQRKRLIFGQMRPVGNEKPPASHSFNPGVLSTHDISIWFNTSERLRVLELIEAVPSLELHYHNDVLQLLHGDKKVSVYAKFRKSTVNFGHISSLEPGAAELIAKITDLLFYDRKNRLRFELSHLSGEKLIYQAFNKAKVQVAPLTPEQAQRFQAYQSTQSLSTGFANLLQNQNEPKNQNDGPTSILK